MTHLRKYPCFSQFSFLLILIAGLLMPPAIAQEGQTIGRVLSTTGSVTARDLNGALRELSRRSDIFVGDTVITGPNGFAQLRMVDSAQIAFQEDTEFTFSEYSSDGPGGAADSALMEMVRGGFRTISGTIGDDDADDYQVSTQFASIGIRGTTHEAVIDAGALLTGVYDGGTTVSNGQGTLDTGEGANFNYSQTFPGQAPQGLLQQPARLGTINLNPGADGDDDGEDGDDDDGNANDNNGANNGGGDDDGNNDGGADDDGNDNGGNGGIADANDENAGARGAPTNQGGPRGGLNNLGALNTSADSTGSTTPATGDDITLAIDINPVINVRARDDFEVTGSGTIEPTFIQPNTAFLALVANSGFNSDFSLSELQGVTGRLSQVLAFNGLADIGGSIGAAAVGDNGPTTSITALTMTFDLNFSANLAQVSNGFLGIKMDDAPTPIAFNIFFSGDIINSQANFIIGSNSNRTQGSQTTSIDRQASFLDAILVDNGVEQALFSDFFFQDTQGLGVEGQALVGFATPVLSPADNARISDRVGFVLSRNSAPGAIFPGNVTELVPGQEVILAGNDLSSPFTLDAEPPYIFRGAGSFLDFTDGTITQPGERPYDFEIGIWGSSSNPVTLFTDFVDNQIFELLDDPLIVVSVDPAPLSSLTGSVVYVSNFDRILGGSSAGSISEFFTAFNVDFATSLITDGVMEFCLGGDESCSGSNAQYWEFDYSGAVANGFVIASPVENQGYINDQLASIFGFIEGVFTGDNAEAFVGGFNLFYDDDLDIYRDSVNSVGVNIPDTTVDGVFLIEKDLRLDSGVFDRELDNDAFLVQEGYARTLLGFSRPTIDEDIFFVDSRSRPRLVLTDPDNEVAITNRNDNLSDVISELFELNWERWEGPLTVSTDNLDLAAIEDGGLDSIHDVAFFSTFNISRMQDITGRYNRVFGFIGENGSGDAITEIEMEFDINFSTSFNNIQNGILDLFVGSDEKWIVFFEGNLIDNVAEFEFFDVNPNAILEAAVVPDDELEDVFSGIYIWNDSSEEFDIFDIDFADSNMQGAIIDNERGTPALLSSFFFREETSGPGRSISGQALVAREDTRIDQIIESGAGNLMTSAIINIPYLNSNNVFFDNNSPLSFNSRSLGVPSDVLRSNNFDVLFTSPAEEYYDCYYYCEDEDFHFFSIDFLQTVDEHVEFAHFDENTFMLSGETELFPEEITTDNTFNLDMGSWDGTIGLFEVGMFNTYFIDSEDYESQITACGSSNFECFGLGQEGFESPAFWLNYNSFYFMPYVRGRISTVLEAFGEFRLTDSVGGIIQVPIETLSIDVIIEFYYPEIHMGNLIATSAASPLLDAPLVWAVEFDYDDFEDLRNGSADATFNITDETDDPITSQLILDLTGTPDFPILVGSFQSSQDFSEGGSVDVAGVFAARQTRIAILVDSFQSLSDTGSVFFGTASRPIDDEYADESSRFISPRIGVNFDGTGGQDIADIDLMHSFDTVLTGDSTVFEVTPYIYDTDPIEVDVDGHWDGGNVDWGFWASTNMTIVHNELNNSPFQSDDAVFWATVNPMSPADLTGTWGYYGYEAIGKGNLIAGGEDVITSFSMGFAVDFNNGVISDGSFSATVGGTDTWAMSFDGNVHGAFAEMNNFGGSFNGSPILGEMGGVFTGTSGDLWDSHVVTGFSLFNNLGDHLDGIGLLHTWE